MICFKRYFSCLFPKQKTFLHPSVNPMTFKAAGSFFTDGKNVLAGFQPNKPDATITGIGGKRENNETYLQTAIRETVEELFDMESVPFNLIQEIELTLVPQQVFQNGSYIYVVYSFKDLEKLLKIVKKYQIKSRVYEAPPLTVSSLVLERLQSVSAEIQRLMLIPISKRLPQPGSISSDLLQDITMYQSFNKTEVEV